MNFGHKFGHGTKNPELGFVPNFLISKIKNKKENINNELMKP